MVNFVSPKLVAYRTQSSGDHCTTCLRDTWGPIMDALNRNLSFANAASRSLEISTALCPTNLEAERGETCPRAS